MTARVVRNSLSAFFAILLAGCTEPSSTEVFVRASDAIDGVYTYWLDLSEKQASYDISFYTRVDRSPVKVRKEYPQIKLEVTWTSPSHKSFSETVYMKGSSSAGDCQKYRSGVVPRELGEWTLKVKAFPMEKGFRGLGVVCEKQWDTIN